MREGMAATGTAPTGMAATGMTRGNGDDGGADGGVVADTIELDFYIIKPARVLS